MASASDKRKNEKKVEFQFLLCDAMRVLIDCAGETSPALFAVECKWHICPQRTNFAEVEREVRAAFLARCSEILLVRALQASHTIWSSGDVRRSSVVALGASEPLATAFEMRNAQSSVMATRLAQLVCAFVRLWRAREAFLFKE